MAATPLALALPPALPHEQRGVEQRESPRGCCRWGPSEARCAPLVRLLLLSNPVFGAAALGTARGISLGRVSGVRGGVRTSRCLSEIKIQQHYVLTVFKGGSFVSLESRSILLS